MARAKPGDVVYWDRYTETYLPIPGTPKSEYRIVEEGITLDWYDPSLWANTSAFPTPSPCAEAVKVYVDAAVTRKELAYWTVPVLWRDGGIRSAPLDELKLTRPAPELAPVPKAAPPKKKTTKPVKTPAAVDPHGKGESPARPEGTGRRKKTTPEPVGVPASGPDLTLLGIDGEWIKLEEV